MIYRGLSGIDAAIFTLLGAHVMGIALEGEVAMSKATLAKMGSM